MKKMVFCIAMMVCFFIVAALTKDVDLGYEFPLDEGGNKLAAGFIAIVTAIWGATMDNIRWSLIIWMVIAVAMAYLFGIPAFIAFMVVCAVTRVWVQSDSEIQDMLRKPFDPEDEN